LFGHYRLRFCYEKPQDESETVWEHLHDEVEFRGGEVVVGEARYSDLHGAMEAYKNMPFFRAVVFAKDDGEVQPFALPVANLGGAQEGRISLQPVYKPDFYSLEYAAMVTGEEADPSYTDFERVIDELDPGTTITFL
jgi:hypothetical protein